MPGKDTKPKMKKQRNRIIACAVVLLMLTSGLGCDRDVPPEDTGASETETNLSTNQPIAEKNLESLASRLLQSQIFTENMTAASPAAIPAIFGCTGLVRNAVSYAGSMATAEEFILFEAESIEAAEQISDKMEAYHQKQQSDFADYRPSEVPKLADAVMQTNGVYYIYCVSTDNEKAESIVREWLNEF